MTTPWLWRISNYIDLRGEGGRIGSARWHTRGKPIVYLAETPAGAMLERIVHLMDMNEEGNLPRAYNLIKVSVLENATIKPLYPFARIDWKESPEFTQQIGDEWLASKATPLARVPSAIIRDTENYLLNPEHPDAAYVRIASVTRERFDRRLFRPGVR